MCQIRTGVGSDDGDLYTDYSLLCGEHFEHQCDTRSVMVDHSREGHHGLGGLGDGMG